MCVLLWCLGVVVVVVIPSGRWLVLGTDCSVCVVVCWCFVDEAEVLLVVECCLLLLQRVSLVFAGVVRMLADLLGGCWRC